SGWAWAAAWAAAWVSAEPLRPEERRFRTTARPPLPAARPAARSLRPVSALRTARTAPRRARAHPQTDGVSYRVPQSSPSPPEARMFPCSRDVVLREVLRDDRRRHDPLRSRESP